MLSMLYQDVWLALSAQANPPRTEPFQWSSVLSTTSLVCLMSGSEKLFDVGRREPPKEMGCRHTLGG